MKLERFALVLMVMVLMSGGRLSAQEVKTDYDHSADFTQYKTYCWERVQTKDPLFIDRIKSAVNAALATKGWTQVDSGGDVSIIAIQTTQDQQTLNTFTTASAEAGVGDGVAAEVLERQPPPPTPIGLARWSWIYTTRKPSNCCFEVLRATRSPTMPTRIPRTWIRASKKYLRNSPQDL